MRAIFGCFGLIVLVAAIDLFIDWVLWLIYNTVAPSFHWPQVGFWTMFLLLVGISLLVGILRGAVSSSSR